MKTIVTIDFDSERERALILSKPTETPKPETSEEASKMLSEDLACMTMGLMLLIDVGSKMGYCNKVEIIKSCINELNKLANNDSVAAPMDDTNTNNG